MPLKGGTKSSKGAKKGSERCHARRLRSPFRSLLPPLCLNWGIKRASASRARPLSGAMAAAVPPIDLRCVRAGPDAPVQSPAAHPLRAGAVATAFLCWGHPMTRTTMNAPVAWPKNVGSNP